MTRRAAVACDLFLDLRLYRVPDDLRSRIARDFPAVEIMEINTETAPPLDRAAVEVYWGNRITRQTIQSLPALRWIHFGSIGVNRADVPEVRDRGIVVTNSRGTMEISVALSALGFLLILARGFHHCERLRREETMCRESFDAHFDDVHELQDENCLIVGMGRVGELLGSYCSSLGMDVTGIRSRPSAAPRGVREVLGFDDLPEAAARADFVVNLLPLTAQTRNIYNADFFASMKRSAFFINVGRGESVDEQALVRALKTGVIAGAGLDVFENEPLTPQSPLWRLPNVVITPHIAGLSNRYWEREGALFVENLGRYLSGRELLNVVDPARGS